VRKDKRKVGTKAGLTDSLQVYSDIRKEQRVPVFILLTGTIICPFARFFSLVLSLCLSLSLALSLFFLSTPSLATDVAALKPYG